MDRDARARLPRNPPVASRAPCPPVNSGDGDHPLKRYWIVLILAVMLGPATQPAAAVAEGEEEAGAFGAFRLNGSNGFSVLVMAFSGPHYKNGKLLVWAAKRDASVMYFVPAEVTATTIDGNLGAVGRISVAFEAGGAPEQVGTNCDKGGKLSFQPGKWVGTIALAGEEGFTRVQETRSKAIVNPFIEAVCGDVISIGELTGHGIRGARLVARSTNGKHALFLQVNKNHRNATVYVETSLEERRGRLLVNRDVVHRYPSGSFSFDPLMRTAT